MPRPKGGTLTEDHRASIAVGTTERWARERERVAQEILDMDPGIFMAGFARGVKNGSIKPKFLQMVLDLAKGADGVDGG